MNSVSTGLFLWRKSGQIFTHQVAREILEFLKVLMRFIGKLFQMITFRFRELIKKNFRILFLKSLKRKFIEL